MTDMHIVREVIQRSAAGMQETYRRRAACSVCKKSAVAAGIVINAAKSGSAMSACGNAF